MKNSKWNDNRKTDNLNLLEKIIFVTKEYKTTNTCMEK